VKYEWEQIEIDALYKKVLGKIKGGKMFGVPIELTNTKHLVVASYLLAKYEGTLVSLEKLADVSKAICAGDWELYAHADKVEIQDLTRPKIVLTDAEAMDVWRVLNKWVERIAEVE